MAENNSNCESDECVVMNFSEIFQLINLLNKKYEKLQRRVVKSENLTPPQYSILMELWKSDGKQFKELASACCCSPSTITGIVDTMEKNELVSREKNPDDRRSLLVKLTDKGKNIESSTPPIKIILTNCCEGFTLEEADKLTYLLNKLSDSFELTGLEKC
ncbi:MAG: MarR family transcriptional regulator [Candidatus Lokiarchaeota archaeon]|nr:MarR family transcriptional regulator [Candidatus Lokiarchaeota archaeon]